MIKISYSRFPQLPLFLSSINQLSLKRIDFYSYKRFRMILACFLASPSAIPAFFPLASPLASPFASPSE